MYSSYYVLKCKAIWLTPHTTQCESVHPANTQQAQPDACQVPQGSCYTCSLLHMVHQGNIGTHGTIGTLALLGACQPFHGAVVNLRHCRYFPHILRLAE